MKCPECQSEVFEEVGEYDGDAKLIECSDCGYMAWDDELTESSRG